MKSIYVIALCLVFPIITFAAPLSKSFTYQGELRHSGVAADGAFDFRFELYGQKSGGSVIGSAVDVDNVQVVDGIFSVELDFGAGPYNGDQLWLKMGVRNGNSTGGYQDLAPRQKVTATPYALYAQYAKTTAPHTHDWAVSIPVSGLYGIASGGNAFWQIASGGAKGPQGLALSHLGYGRVFGGFTLPPQYQSGSSIYLRVAWAPDVDATTGCKYLLELNNMDIIRGGSPSITKTVAWENPGPGFGAVSTRLVVPADKTLRHETYLKIDGAMLPGDHIGFAINRNPTDSNDTCTKPLYIPAMSAGTN